MLVVLIVILYLLFFSSAQGIVLITSGTSPAVEAKRILLRIRKAPLFVRKIAEKQLKLKRLGADIFLKDNLTVSGWYIYKALFSAMFFLTALVVSRIADARASSLISTIALFFGWFALDLFLYQKNKSSNDEMLPDIMEMSRSVLYGKRGGEYIADAIRDSVFVVENKRLKTALISLQTSLDNGVNLADCLDDFEDHFSNSEISAFCTIVKSLQYSGQVNEALRTLESNIAREQDSVNKRRTMKLERKTMLYVILISIDLLGMILYCIVLKLLEMMQNF